MLDMMSEQFSLNENILQITQYKMQYGYARKLPITVWQVT